MSLPVRSRLAELLIQAFDDPEKGVAIHWLNLYCDIAGRRKGFDLPLVDLLKEGATYFDHDGGEDTLACLIGPRGFLRLRRLDTGELWAAGSTIRMDLPWMIGLEADVRSAFSEVRDRARAYAAVLTSPEASRFAPFGSHPLPRAMAQAAACFNAGLFFEAHEHLEQFWRDQSKGPVKRFLQGVIQISVGFHHAHRGSYEGAVNQLAKGLEKTAGLTGEILGLDCDAFLPAVAGFREAIVARGRGAMRPIPLIEIPRMPVWVARPSHPGRAEEKRQAQEGEGAVSEVSSRTEQPR